MSACCPAAARRAEPAARPRSRVNNLDLAAAETTTLVNGRWLPPAHRSFEANGPCVGLVGDEVAYAVLEPRQSVYCSWNTIEDCLETWKKTSARRDAGGSLVHHPWDLVDRNAEQIQLDWEHLPKGAVHACADRGYTLVGPEERLLVDPTARIEPMVLFDTSAGPIIIEREAVVTAFTRLEGPCVIGAGTHILRREVRAGSTFGPQCRIGGEVEASIVQGYSNKYHEGFLGHSYLGAWVNLGAGTHNSDLRNDYGPVRVRSNGTVVDTGLKKVGCFLGDHTKTGLGTLLNTGTSVGVFCNLLPTGKYLPKYLPSFTSWWNGTLRENTTSSACCRPRRTVMSRRGKACTVHDADLYRVLFDQGTEERRRALREAEQRPLRLSA